ncbi:CIC11C00000000053 [Sungouiella intermedia]|uniref:CIC11C00000000053 n=1 Tax=Sungouiella intermedia TaxID=45354 RepID=A0A1L0BXQ4_9ASCO|nr:CIC11C00000000053 [[Candida] intermedia]
MSFQVFNQISAPQDHVYKLVQLPPDLVAYMKDSPQKPLHFKSPASSNNHLVLCTDDSTYTVRQVNHSNTVLLVNDMSVNKYGKKMVGLNDNPSFPDSQNTLLAIGLSTYQYQLTSTPGYIDSKDIPIYDGRSKVDVFKTVDQVRNDSPIAVSAFFPAWYRIRGCDINGLAVILAPEFVTEVLHTLISILIAQKLDNFTLQDIEERAKDQNSNYTKDILVTVTENFCERKDGMLQLHKPNIAQWFGIETLKSCLQALPDKELLLKWKSSLPPFFNVLLDLSLLHGYYCRPTVGKIRYLPRDSLAGDIQTRVKEMFLIVKEWDFDEFLPYVAEFVPSTKKPDAVILKFARKKRVGKKFVVCPR